MEFTVALSKATNKGATDSTILVTKTKKKNFDTKSLNAVLIIVNAILNPKNEFDISQK